MANIYDVNGNIVDINGGSSNPHYDSIVKGINHRGYNTVAPENTLPAFKLSKRMGFNYVETDISWTSDDIPVLSHDNDISRCSDGTGTISSMTYEQLLQYDFGSWKSAEYAGTKIPTAEQFLKLCRALGLHPYLELKNGVTETRVQALVDLVNACGMKGHVSYISFYDTRLNWVKAYDATARLGYLPSSWITEGTITIVQALKTATNEVFIDVDRGVTSDANIQIAIAAHVPVEFWTVNNADYILGASPYVTGFTSDNLIAGKVLYNANST